ncbi:hypothetical protein pETSU_182 [Edwardsiella phage pEt-SU]|uniref:Uncharacterized protein n=1 Tax=Edwardsiella phage pEt-SU TaxID=2562142 RepID=A0A4D6DWQ1_9CAUD|nr:hypothetical protein HOV39_gp182 [Edwardsiella phage pEt-SU]QBZ70763.1 hypothetical protein pETSU_182 [Edwardsiella phage pEt-SU]
MEFEHIGGMESLHTDFDMAYNLSAGLGAIATAGHGATVEGYEASYAMTVFTLNDIDFAGQEGFLDSVKRGARKVYEWIKDLIKTIRGWFTGSSKAKYEEAKKEITGADIALVNQVKKLKDRGIDAHIEYNKDSAEYRIIKKISAEDKAKINEEINKVEIEGVNSPKDIFAKIESEIITDISTKVGNRLKTLNSKVDEIRRIDPDGTTLESLGLDGRWNFITDAARLSDHKWLVNGNGLFTKKIENLVYASDEAQSELAKATVALDKMNEAGKGHDDKAQQLSRAVAVVRLLTDIAGIWRDTVISINSQTQKAMKDMTDGIVKEALRKAKSSTDEATTAYINEMMKNL